MQLIDYFQSYIHYLIHPFKTHEAFMGKQTDLSFTPKKMSLYESLGASWVFIVFNGIVRILLVNFVLFAFLKISDSGAGIFSTLSNEDGFLGFYFLILSTILDVIFYPLFTLFIVQFWEFVIKIFGKALGEQENLDEKARDIMTVALSSHIFVIVPVLGSMAQKFAALILMYAGLRKQLNASAGLSVCIMLVPVLMMLMLFSLIMLIVVLRLL
jgi:hypothetical protein